LAVGEGTDVAVGTTVGTEVNVGVGKGVEVDVGEGDWASVGTRSTVATGVGKEVGARAANAGSPVGTKVVRRPMATIASNPKAMGTARRLRQW
jgi:hypothetical protein